MTLDRIGGACMLVAGAAFAVVLAQPRPDIDATGADVTVPAALFGLGAALVSAAGSRPLDARTTRIGVALLALGAFAVVVAGVLEKTGNPMASLTPTLIAAAALVSGSIATGVSLWWPGGLARVVGTAILAGVALVLIGQVVGGAQVSPPPILQAGFVVGGLGLVGVGALALGVRARSG